jgi:hypothetical protein
MIPSPEDAIAAFRSAYAQVAQVFGTHRLKADGVLQLVELPLQAR